MVKFVFPLHLPNPSSILCTAHQSLSLLLVPFLFLTPTLSNPYIPPPNRIHFPDLATNLFLFLFLSQIGILRFVGTTEFASGIWAGVELFDPSGDCDGTFHGVRYFECPITRGQAMFPLCLSDLDNRIYMCIYIYMYIYCIMMIEFYLYK